MRLLLLARHGQSLFNVDRVVNGDPARDRGLSPQGEQEARELGRQLAAHAIDACVTSRFPRAQETARLALEHRDVPASRDADLDDVRIGDLEGRTIDDYRAWKRGHERGDPFPGGRAWTTPHAATPTRSSGSCSEPRRRSSASATRSRCATP